MNRTKTEELPSSTNQDADTQQTKKQSYDRKRPNRKGKGAQNKSSEAFRRKQNAKTQAGIDAMIEDIKDKLRINVERAFGSRIPPGTTKPVQEVKPKSWILAEICERVIIVLETAGKIRFNDQLNRNDGLRALQIVSAAQLEAKMYFARIGAPHRAQFEFDQEYHLQMEYIASAFPNNFTPIVNYIEQFGRFQHGGQEFVPWAPENDEEYVDNFCTYRAMRLLPHAVVDREGHRILPFLRPIRHGPPNDFPLNREVPGLGPNGRPMYQVVVNEQHAIAVGGVLNENRQFICANEFFVPGIIEFREAELEAGPLQLDLEANGMLWSTLMTMVAKKFARALPHIDFKGGKGTAIQLVASEPTQRGFRRAWSSRDVGTDVLCLGAIFKTAPIGPDRDYPIYNRDVAFVETDVQCQGAIATYVDTIHGDFTSNG